MKKLVLQFAVWVIKKLQGKTASITPSDSFSGTGLDDTYLFDFKNYLSSYGGLHTTTASGVGSGMFAEAPDDGPMEGNAVFMPSEPNVPEKVQLAKVAVKPKDVLDQLEVVPRNIDLTILDSRIAMMKDKEKLITQKYSKREVSAMIVRLTNRKKYHKHKAFFEQFDNTTDEKIAALLEKHGLVQKAADLFIPEFPDEAIKVMKDYTEKVLQICDKKPVFYVIAEDSKFQQAYAKRDPILLVQSPFGFYWQILGAWDEEMLILSEL